MNVINVKQGSQEWLNLRSTHLNASEAPVMMGKSKYATRNELLKHKATGLGKEVSWYQQYLFDKGHEVEAQARLLLEDQLGEPLFNVVATKDNLLSSYDGVTMDETIGFEHKLWNEKLAEQVRNEDLEPHYYWQLEQQILTGGLKKVIFVCSDGTKDNWQQMDYYPVAGRVAQLIAGWQQFEQDAANFKPEPIAEPQPTGTAPETLPALLIEVTGKVTNSNLDLYKSHAFAIIDKINKNLVTDADFADAEKTVKWCADVESKLKAAKDFALSQTATIDILFKAIDDISAQARATRLELEKLVKVRKENIKTELVMKSKANLTDYICKLTLPANIAFPVNNIHADFANVIKGKKTIDSIKNSLDTELARVKIEVSNLYSLIITNYNTYGTEASEHYSFLFQDLTILVSKPTEDFQAVMMSRIGKYKNDRLLREQQEALAKANEALKAKQVAEQTAPVIEKVPHITYCTNNPVVPITQSPCNNDELVTLTEINTALGFQITADFLTSLGFNFEQVKQAKKYKHSDFRNICNAIINHINAVALWV